MEAYKEGGIGGDVYKMCDIEAERGTLGQGSSRNMGGGGSRLEGEKSKQKLRVFVKAMGEIYSLVC